MSLKELAKVGKSVLRQLSGSVEKYSLVEVEENHADICPYADLSDQNLRDKLCSAFCNHTAEPKAHILKYRLSKYQILQFLYYHFLPVDSMGIVSNISEREVAEKLGCTLRTVRNNNAVLADLELIHYSRYDSQHFNVMIIPYTSYHENKENGGSGYLPFYLKHFELLLETDNVNTLRFELRMLMKYDSDAPRRKFNKIEASEITKKETETFMAKHVRTLPMLSQTVQKKSDAFQIEFVGSTVFFLMDERFNGKLIKEQNEKLFTSELEKCLENSHVSITLRADFDSLVQLSFEYSLNEVLDALKEWHMDIHFNESARYVSNPGGYIRTKIRQARMHKQKRAITEKMTA